MGATLCAALTSASAKSSSFCGAIAVVLSAVATSLPVPAHQLPHSSRPSQPVSDARPRFLDGIPAQEQPDVSGVCLAQEPNDNLVAFGLRAALQQLVYLGDSLAEVPGKVGDPLWVEQGVGGGREHSQTIASSLRERRNLDIRRVSSRPTLADNAICPRPDRRGTGTVSSPRGRSCAVNPVVTVFALLTAMQMESDEGWVVVGSSFTAIPAGSSTKKNFSGFLRYVRYELVTNTTTTFEVSGVGRRWA